MSKKPPSRTKAKKADGMPAGARRATLKRTAAIAKSSATGATTAIPSSPPTTAAAPLQLKAAKKATRPSMYTAIKEILVRAPKTTTDELMAELTKAGFAACKVATVAMMRSDTLSTLRVIQAANLHDFGFGEGR
jgi:hypothetical protein